MHWKQSATDRNRIDCMLINAVIGRFRHSIQAGGPNRRRLNVPTCDEQISFSLIDRPAAPIEPPVEASGIDAGTSIHARLVSRKESRVAPECSVIIPLCNEEHCLPTLHLRLTATLRRMAVPFEIIYVDDGSTDDTSTIISELHEQDEAVKGVFLSRNFGQQAALCAGLDVATGRAIITLDGDLQDPPELIPRLMEAWHAGNKVVYARRRKRPEHLLKRAASYSFYRILKRVSQVPIVVDSGDYALMDRQVVAHLASLPERTRFIRGLRAWIGFKQTEIEYDREPRREGRSKSSLPKLIKLGMDGLFSFSWLPIKAISMAGVIAGLIALAGLLRGAIGLAVWFTPVSEIWWLGTGIAAFSGIQLLAVGIIGEYMARVHEDVRGRPLYVVREKLGFDMMPRPVPHVLEFLSSDATRTQETATRRRIDSETVDHLVVHPNSR